MPSCPPQRLRSDKSDLLKALLDHSGLKTKAAGENAGGCYIHVEAGIKINQLLKDLKDCGLALRTMGAGGGQSLAGAVSTSTHGGDFAATESPLGDAIRAVQLIDEKGDELWIAGSETPFSSQWQRKFFHTAKPSSNEQKSAKQPGENSRSKHEYPYVQSGYKYVEGRGSALDQSTCLKMLSEMKDHSGDDLLLRAVQTAVGRLGVIYAVVLEVVPAYTLIEVNHRHTWTAIREQLKDGNITVKKDARRAETVKRSGIFHAPLNLAKLKDLQDGVETSTRDAWHGDGLAVISKLDNDETLPLRHLNIVLNLAHSDECWVNRRWRHDDNLTPSFQVGEKITEKNKKLMKLIKDSEKEGGFKDLPMKLLKAARKLAEALLEDTNFRTFPLGMQFEDEARERATEAVEEILTELLLENRPEGRQISSLHVDSPIVSPVKTGVAKNLSPLTPLIELLVAMLNQELKKTDPIQGVTPKRQSRYTDDTRDRLIGFAFIVWHRVVRDIHNLNRNRLDALKSALTTFQDQVLQDIKAIIFAETRLETDLETIVKRHNLKDTSEPGPLPIGYTPMNSTVTAQENAARQRRLAVTTAWGLDKDDNEKIREAIKALDTPVRAEKIKLMMNKYRNLKRTSAAIEEFKGKPTMETLVGLISSFLIAGEYGKPFRIGLATDIFDTHDYTTDGLTKGSSAEFFFNASNPDNYLKFIDKVRGLAGSEKKKDGADIPYPVMGYVGIRFMRKSKALLAMQRFDFTVSVEVTVPRSALEDVYAGFRHEVNKAAYEFGGIPHWGQEFERDPNTYCKANLRGLYEAEYDQWLQKRREIASSKKFATSFTTDCGLEDEE